MSNSDISKTCIKLRTLWESYNMTSHIKQKNAILIDLTNTALLKLSFQFQKNSLITF
jgi:hypothetical protein